VAEPPEGALSYGFEHLLREVRRAEPAMRLVAVQSTARLGGPGRGSGRRFLLRVTGKRLLESVHCTDGSELLILDRGQAHAYRWEAIYGSVATYVPLASIRRADRADVGEVTTSTIQTDGGTITHTFLRDNPTVAAYHDYLARCVTSIGAESADAPIERDRRSASSSARPTG
jgi:hypothetical protein